MSTKVNGKKTLKNVKKNINRRVIPEVTEQSVLSGRSIAVNHVRRNNSRKTRNDAHASENPTPPDLLVVCLKILFQKFGNVGEVMKCRLRSQSHLLI